MTMPSPSILIIGAGPTGLTAALEFAKHNIKVDIVEKRAGPSPLSKAVGIMPESLKKLGPNVADKIRKQGIPFYKVNMHIGTKRILSLDLTDRITTENIILGLPQDETEEILREELMNYGISVKYNKEVNGINTTTEKVAVRFKGDLREYEYDWAIACDGVRSFVRKKIGIAFPGYKLKKPWSIADVEIEEGLDFDAFNAFLKLGENKDDAVVAIPIGKNRIRVISSTEDSLATLPKKLTVTKIRRQDVFNIKVAIADTFAKGRILLAGDAAHCHSPVGGKGMNLGIEDAVSAVQAVINGTPENYSDVRRRRARQVIRSTEIPRRGLMSSNPLVRYFFIFLFSTINKLSFLQPRVMKQISKL